MLVTAPLDSYPVMTASVLFCLLVLLYELFRIFAEGFRARYFLVSSLSCGIWISISFMVSFFKIDHSKLFNFKNLISTIFYTNIIITSSSYSLASSYLMFFIAGASAVSRWTAIGQAEYEFQRIVLKKLKFYSNFNSSVVLLFLSVFGLIISGLNLIVVRGLSEDVQSDQGILPWWYPLILIILSLFPVVIASCMNQDFRLVSPRGLLVSVGIIVALYFAALEGRRSIVFLFVTLPLIWLLIFKPLFKLTTRTFAYALFLILVLWLLSPAISTIFDFINYARGLRGGSIDPSQFLTLFVDFLADPRSLSDASELSSENLAARPLVLWPLAASITMAINGLNSDYLYFQDIVNSFLNSLPRFIIPFKAQLFLQENLLYTYFPFSNIDTADSPYLYAFVSFGILGIVIYPLLIGLLYWTFLHIATSSIEMLTGIPAFISSALAFTTVTSFAIVSYGEISTSQLIRLFLLPAAAIFIISIICAPFRTSAKT